MPLITPVPPATPPRVNFDWAPKSVALTLTVGASTYPYSTQQDGVSRSNDDRYLASTTPTNQSITFTADVTTYNGAFVTEHLWDFGNGIRAYGATAVYTFRVPNPAQQVSLLVRDSNDLRGSAVHYLNLVFAQPTVVKPAIRV